MHNRSAAFSSTDFQGSVSPQGLMGSFGLQKWGGGGVYKWDIIYLLAGRQAYKCGVDNGRGSRMFCLISLLNIMCLPVHSSSNGQTEPVSSATVTLTNLTAAPIVKRSPSCPGDNEPESCALQNTTRPAKVKRTSSSAGMPSPVPSPMSPPSVRVKQEKSDILDDLSTCHGVQKPVSTSGKLRT